jgi:hypothetical protein
VTETTQAYADDLNGIARDGIDAIFQANEMDERTGDAAECGFGADRPCPPQRITPNRELISKRAAAGSSRGVRPNPRIAARHRVTNEIATRQGTK